MMQKSKFANYKPEKGDKIKNQFGQIFTIELMKRRFPWFGERYVLFRETKFVMPLFELQGCLFLGSLILVNDGIERAVRRLGKVR